MLPIVIPTCEIVGFVVGAVIAKTVNKALD